MTDRIATTLIISTVLALLGMGWCLAQTTGAVVVGRPPAAAVIDPTAVALRASHYQDPAAIPGDAALLSVPGRSADMIELRPDESPIAIAVVAELLELERSRAEPGEWTLRARLDALGHEGPPTDPEAAAEPRAPRVVAAIVVTTDERHSPGTIHAISIGGGRATAPWLRRALAVAGGELGSAYVPEIGWREVRARAGLATFGPLGGYLESSPDGEEGVPAIGVRIGVAGGGATPPAARGALIVLRRLLDQLQTEAALPKLGPDRFAPAPRKFLTPFATAWLWVFPLLPLTAATGTRYGILARGDPEFTPLVLKALRPLGWWALPCVGAAVVLTVVPSAPGEPLAPTSAAVWGGAVGVLSVVALRGGRRARPAAVPQFLGAALVLDLLWSTYLVAVIARPWGAGTWLAPAVFLLPWVVPAAGGWRGAAAVAWLGGIALPAYWFAQVTHALGVLGMFGWLAADVPAWCVLLGGFAGTVGLYLAWWSTLGTPVPRPRSRVDSVQ